MSTIITENSIPMSIKENFLAILDSYIMRITEDLNTAHSEYGRLRREDQAEYKDVRKADMNCSRLEGQKDAFELISNIFDKEIPDMDYVPKSVESTRISICTECVNFNTCIAKHYTSYQKGFCPDKKW